MAAAEARAAWQRAANRCLVQEDAKRAPKLACCPSSSTLQHDSSNGNATNGVDHPATNFMPLDWNPMNSNLPPDTKWWLQLQPNYGYQKDRTYEQLKSMEDELDENSFETPDPCKLTREQLAGEPVDVDLKKDAGSFESPWMVSTAFMKHETRVEEMKTVNSITQQPLKRKIDMGDYLYGDEELMDWKPVDRLISKKPEKASSDLEIPWAGGGKPEPWWRITDKDELASLVAQKSLEHVENCDLPKPTQSVHVDGCPFACLDSLDSYGMFSSSLGQKLHAGTTGYAQESFTSGSMDYKHWSSGEGGGLLHDTNKLYSGIQDFVMTKNNTPESTQTSESDPSRAQLLEALCHSQTRARKAEIAAQKAFDEKDHIIKLLFKQASHLFAYKQWLQMLQLESLCLQLKIQDHQISTLFPVLPWMPLKGPPSSKDRSSTSKRKGKKQRKCNICRYAVVFAVGFGLAGAGLFLGWTLGWLLPRF